MSVLLETSLGDIVIDLEIDVCPRTCENFLKLCKMYYYNLNAFFNGSSYNSLHVLYIEIVFSFEGLSGTSWRSNGNWHRG